MTTTPQAGMGCGSWRQRQALRDRPQPERYEDVRHVGTQEQLPPPPPHCITCPNLSVSAEFRVLELQPLNGLEDHLQETRSRSTQTDVRAPTTKVTTFEEEGNNTN
ncbi:unnamed protein product [Pleuronectes platessa]|uniref:Uncharacterized protein n=1 Tax=Pleuronectes platessa TaxID=8262 RepID=A0A9N7YG06_PLEPL|nr:unnamed protein product [Pleuronectes platessa]